MKTKKIKHNKKIIKGVIKRAVVIVLLLALVGGGAFVYYMEKNSVIHFTDRDIIDNSQNFKKEVSENVESLKNEVADLKRQMAKNKIQQDDRLERELKAKKDLKDSFNRLAETSLKIQDSLDEAMTTLRAERKLNDKLIAQNKELKKTNSDLFLTARHYQSLASRK